MTKTQAVENAARIPSGKCAAVTVDRYVPWYVLIEWSGMKLIEMLSWM